MYKGLKSTFFLCVGIFLLISFSSSNSGELKFLVTYNGQPLVLNDTLLDEDSNQFTISAFRFYVGEIKLFYNEFEVGYDSNYHLIDIEKPQSQSLIFNTDKPLKFNKVEFVLGVDSATSNSGAMGGDLDPTKGMYWTWNSGYINFKLEGRHAKCYSRNKEFAYHLGGYASPFATAVAVRVPVKNGEVSFELSDFVNELQFNAEPRVMSPGIRAKSLSKTAATCFK
ncbi:MAG: hypothetical protein KDC92_12500 [Bacteroidetes bacterium]|nr:hypothetical protein [Bacteroidota bacterium]